VLCGSEESNATMKLPHHAQDQLLKNPFSPQDQVLLYHTVLIAAANLIPVPFVDDFVMQKIRRNMVRELWRATGGKTISSKEVHALTSPYAIGCGTGCLFGGFWIFIKKFFSDINLFLDIQRSAGLVADTYCYGYLLNQLFASNSYQQAMADKYGLAITDVMKKTNLDLLKQAFSKSLETAKGMLWSISGWLVQFSWFYLRQATRVAWMKIRSIFLWLIGRKLPESMRARLENADFKEFFEDKTPNIHYLINTVAELFQVNLKTNVLQQYLDTLTESLFFDLSKVD